MKTRKLQESELDDILTSCIFCGSVYLKSTGVELQNTPCVTYLRCESCFAKIVDRQPNRQFLETLYRPEQYMGSVARSATNASRFAKRILGRGVLEDLRSQSEIPHILDFGGGSGRLAAALRDRLARVGATATVVDIHPPTLDLDVEYLPSSDTRTLRSSCFSLIVASASIEHLKQPGQTLQDLHSACAAGGYLYFRVPSNFPLGRVFRRILSFPEHLSHLGPQFWDKLPRLLDWSVEVIYSRPSISDAPLKEDPISALGSKAFKIPANLEVALRSRLKKGTIARYECGGAWEVLYRKTGQIPRPKTNSLAI